MDGFSRSWYELRFENYFLSKQGNEFQKFFADLMEKRFPDGDFIRVRPWGKSGDKKNDGCLKSKRMLFQVYAPNEMTEREAKNKIDEDFSGALLHWKQYFDKWTFVHNDRAGLGPGITKKLLDLDQENELIEVTSWGFEELRRNLFELSESDIASLLGPAPSKIDFLRIGYEEINSVLKFISRQSASPLTDMQKVPREKIEINKLSGDVESLINMGRIKSSYVGNYFKEYPDPEYGDQIAQAFKERYEELKNANLSPDNIFQELQIFCGGELIQGPKHQAAVLSIMAYLFDQCDIFESTRDI